MNKDPIKIDLNDWEKFGEGHTASSWYSKSDDSVVLKLYSSKMPPNFGYKELTLSEAVSKMGISTPKALEYVTTGNCCGAVFQRIKGKRSFYRELSLRPERADELAKVFAETMQNIHKTPCDKDFFRSAEDYYENAIAASTVMTKSQKDKAREVLSRVPHAETCLHGDMTFGNIILDENDDVYIIDLPEFSYGYELFDFGMPIMQFFYTKEEARFEDTHTERAVFDKAWKLFFSYYFNEPNPEKIMEELKPYAVFSAAYLSTHSPARPFLKEIFQNYLGE